jgi:1-acyl-sn-glycerol-3-phosphate acyltransferase
MLKTVCSLLAHLEGWTFDMSSLPSDLKSFIILGAPHTSNFDIVPSMALAKHLNRNCKFVIKEQWTRFPMGLIMKPAGAIGLNREKLKGGPQSTTDLMAALFTQFQDLVLMIAPEGTRSPNPVWKTGFYFIAQKAKVPLVLGYGDFRTKIAGTGPVIYPTDLESDMKIIMNFYKSITPKVPQNFLLDERYRD